MVDSYVIHIFFSHNSKSEFEIKINQENFIKNRRTYPTTHFHIQGQSNF